MKHSFVKTLSPDEQFPFKFSICTLVSKPDQYQDMLDSFVNAGFDHTVCEYLAIDNCKSNVYDGFSGLNRFLRESKGKYIILCHQDIVLNDHRITDLESRIDEIDIIDPKWAILSNAGGINLKYLSMHLIQKCGNRLLEENFPLKATTVDENFIIVKNQANLALSSDLAGFHMYGTDICLIAEILGFNAYIIDFYLTHKSNGTVDKRFYDLKYDLMKKYRKALRGRFLSTTITRMYISGNIFGFHILNTAPIMFLVRQYYKFFTSKSDYRAEAKPVKL